MPPHVFLTASAWDRIVARYFCPNLPFVLLHDKIPRYAGGAIEYINQRAVTARFHNE